MDDLSSAADEDKHVFRLHVHVDKQRFEQSLLVPKNWDADKQKKYKQFTQNCVHFTAEVGRAIGLKVPEGVDFTHPGTFVYKLIQM